LAEKIMFIIYINVSRPQHKTTLGITRTLKKRKRWVQLCVLAQTIGSAFANVKFSEP
jgi:hypothetical protein